jgi:hypothetical protein
MPFATKTEVMTFDVVWFSRLLGQVHHRPGVPDCREREAGANFRVLGARLACEKRPRQRGKGGEHREQCASVNATGRRDQ